MEMYTFPEWECLTALAKSNTPPPSTLSHKDVPANTQNAGVWDVKSLSKDRKLTSAMIPNWNRFNTLKINVGNDIHVHFYCKMIIFNEYCIFYVSQPLLVRNGLMVL